MNIRKVLGGLTTSSLILLVAGCSFLNPGLPEGKNPEDIISEAIMNQDDIVKGTYNLSMDADISGEVDGVSEKAKGTASMSGTMDIDESLFSMKMSVNGEYNEDTLVADIEIRSNEDGVFVKIAKVDINNEEYKAIVDGFLKDYMDKWVKLSFLRTGDLVNDETFAFDVEEPAEGEEPFVPFKNLEYVGTKSILGVNSYEFSAELDEEAVIEQMEKEGEYTADMNEIFAMMNFTGSIYVAVEEKVITGAKGQIVFDDPEVTGTVDIDFQYNPNKVEKVDTPTHEEEITEEDVAALLFGGAMMGPEMDDSMMMDDETMKALDELDTMEMDDDAMMDAMDELEIPAVE